ncbi:hypothetical protein [Paenibacillus sp. NPDC057934]|uniref:hypothetical protein n=1 Tax=Paenibacillus sp. NPDC057934 TaxID=3346282 RepID=UPI0036DC6732
MNIVIDEYLALAWCNGGDDDDGGGECGEYPQGNCKYENKDGARDRGEDGGAVYVHGHNIVFGDLLAEILEIHGFLVSWMYSFRFLILHNMPIH